MLNVLLRAYGYSIEGRLHTDGEKNKANKCPKSRGHRNNACAPCGAWQQKKTFTRLFSRSARGVLCNYLLLIRVSGVRIPDGSPEPCTGCKAFLHICRITKNKTAKYKTPKTTNGINPTARKIINQNATIIKHTPQSCTYLQGAHNVESC